jgi:hypothetical protein
MGRSKIAHGYDPLDNAGTLSGCFAIWLRNPVVSLCSTTGYRLTSIQDEKMGSDRLRLFQCVHAFGLKVTSHNNKIIGNYEFNSNNSRTVASNVWTAVYCFHEF